eukprot:CAMPEP_0185024468 /NCGR_PEP_ID=MMETSP1103-20130426/7559_1 /TAXON_ID=36769 /ORGANISM="Paraphysomonas bandaiensis, Strain Caron Lab Isolate" /LENGTH=221 /DNA_ID=CAMNT_0027557447 /DNA_START=83 /DNA_END=748 /DNA_ORIENTATION=-
MQHKELDEQSEGQSLVDFKKVEPSVWLKRLWFLCLFFSVVYVLVAILAADDNEKSEDGVKALGFSALWSSALLIIVMCGSAKVVFYGNASPHTVGMLIGSSAMLAQLFFVLMIVFFVFSEHASTHGHDVKDTDKAMGSFALFSLIVMGLWSFSLYTFRDTLIKGPPVGSSSDSGVLAASAASAHEADEHRGLKSDSQLKVNDIELDEDEVVDVDLEESEAF